MSGAHTCSGRRGRLGRLSLQPLVLTICLLLSLLLRVNALDVFITTDEPTWRDRSIAFERALQARDWGGTRQSEHPGVLTMWCGVAGVRMSRLSGSGESSPPGVALETLWARRTVALVTWLGIVVLSLLLRRAWPGAKGSWGGDSSSAGPLFACPLAPASSRCASLCVHGYLTGGHGGFPDQASDMLSAPVRGPRPASLPSTRARR